MKKELYTELKELEERKREIEKEIEVKTKKKEEQGKIKKEILKGDEE